jgi:hypothetical protein
VSFIHIRHVRSPFQLHPEKILYALKSWTDHTYATRRLNFCFWSYSYASTLSHNCFNSSIKGFNITLMFVLGWSGPGMMRHRNMYSYFMQRAGGRLYGIAKTGQQEYDAALILYSENPSVTNPMHTFYASLAESALKSSRAFHASLSDGCTITWSFSHTSSLCHLMCLAVFFEIKNFFIRGVRGL